MTITPRHSGPPGASSRTTSFRQRVSSLAQRASLRTIMRLQGGYKADSPASVAAVARLRREVGRDPYASPASWGIDDVGDLTDLRDQLLREQYDLFEGQELPGYLLPPARRAREEREDRAVHLAVTLWALHQQSIRDASMHASGWPLGRAVRRLARGRTGTEDPAPPGGSSGTDEVAASQKEGPSEEMSEAVRKRFVRIGTSTDFEVLSGRLRQMVLLLRTARIPLDYSRLAGQLVRWQDERHQEDVRREWGREFHRTHQRPTGRGDESVPTAESADAPQEYVNEDAGD